MANPLRDSKNIVQAKHSLFEAPCATAIADSCLCYSIDRLVKVRGVFGVKTSRWWCFPVLHYLCHLKMSLPWVFGPIALLLVVLHFLAIGSAICIQSVRRYFDPEVIHQSAENAGRSLAYRDSGLFQPVRRPTLLSAKGNQSRYSSEAHSLGTRTTFSCTNPLHHPVLL